jgi:hypothetical protein
MQRFLLYGWFQRTPHTYTVPMFPIPAVGQLCGFRAFLRGKWAANEFGKLGIEVVKVANGR